MSPNEQVRRDELYGRDALVEQATDGVDHEVDPTTKGAPVEGRAFAGPTLPPIQAPAESGEGVEGEAPPPPDENP